GPALRHAQQVHDFDSTRQGRNRRNTLWPNPSTRPKPRGLLSGATIRGTLIGVLGSLKKHEYLLRQLGPRRPTACFLFGRKERTQRSPACGPFPSPSNQRNDLRLARGSLSGPLGNLRLARGQRVYPRAGDSSPPRSMPPIGTRDK